MRLSRSTFRVLPTALLAVAVVGAGGCSWFHKGPRGDYALPAQERPLEVPPDLNVPDTSSAMQVPALASARQPGRPAQAGAPAGNGFTVAGARDEVFGRVGDALANIPGVTIASRAQLLGSFDVSYEGANFLVRVSEVEAGSSVSAVDPRGLPATAEAPTKLIAALKAALGN